MASCYDHDVGTDRIQNPSEVDVEDIQCTICSNVLWKPVACQSCETPFCSMCISRWIEKNPNVCPMKCPGYKERACPRFVIKQLAKAQFFCIYRSNGCNQIIPYEALEKHETHCEYQKQQCPKCRSDIIQKDFTEHVTQCTPIMTASSFTSIHEDNTTCSTEIHDLKQQIQQLRHESIENKDKFEKQLHEYQQELEKLRDENCRYIKQIYRIQEFLFPSHITFSDITPPSGYIEISPGYKNMDWKNFQFTSKSFQNQIYMCRIPFTDNQSDSVASCSGQGAISVSHLNKPFNITSLNIILPGQWDFRFELIGYRKSTQHNNQSFMFKGPASKNIDLNWTEINELKFYCNGHFLLTDLVLAPSF